MRHGGEVFDWGSGLQALNPKSRTRVSRFGVLGLQAFSVPAKSSSAMQNRPELKPPKPQNLRTPKALSFTSESSET